MRVQILQVYSAPCTGFERFSTCPQEGGAAESSGVDVQLKGPAVTYIPDKELQETMMVKCGYQVSCYARIYARVIRAYSRE